MDKNTVFSNVGDALTSKPLKVKVPLKNLNFFDRILIKAGVKKDHRTFEIKPLLVGNRYRISSRVVHIPDDMFKSGFVSALLNPRYVKDYIYCVAVGIKNSRREPSKKLLDFIEFQFDDRDLYLVLTAIFDSIPVKDFINSTVILKGSNVLSA